MRARARAPVAYIHRKLPDQPAAPVFLRMQIERAQLDDVFVSRGVFLFLFLSLIAPNTIPQLAV
jgi:hypothetical protein